MSPDRAEPPANERRNFVADDLPTRIGGAAPSRLWTVDELAEAAGVTPEIMLRRIATVLEKRPWYRRLWLYIRRPQPRWVIHYADKDMPAEHFEGDGAEKAARRRFDQQRGAWSISLYQEVARG